VNWLFGRIEKWTISPGIVYAQTPVSAQ
jgi:hypothetical protein